MKSMINKAIALIVFASLSLGLAGCAGNAPALPITEMAKAEAGGIVDGISRTDPEAAADFLEMKDEKVEDFFADYGYNIDGAAFKNGLDGWLALKEEFGEVTGISEPIVTSNDKEVIATFNIQGTKRTGKCVVVMDGKDRITSITTSADYTVVENMEKAGLNTLLGMGTTFAILIFLSIIISCFQLLPGSGGRKDKEDKKAAPLENAVSQIAAREELASENEIDDGELVAVITAAIAAYQSAGGSAAGSDGFVVRSIRRHC